MMNGRVTRVVPAVLLVLLPITSRADLFYFTQGGQIQAEPLEGSDAGSTLIRLPGVNESFRFRAIDFRKIVRTDAPEILWETRKPTASSAGAPALLRSVCWALEHGLTPQAEALIRESSAAGETEPALTRLARTLQRLDRPAADPDSRSEAIRHALAASFDELRSTHVLLLHQHPTAQAAERLDLLERVVRTYYLLFAAQGLELAVPDERLVLAWYGDQADYLRFLDGEGARAFRGTLGYYHPTLGAVITFDVRTTPDQRKERDGITRRLHEIERLPSAERRDRLGREMARRSLLLENERLAFECGTSAHEMVHLLVARSGLAPRHDDFPLWLHEGLSAQFEVFHGGQWAGVSRPHDLRLPDWRRIDPPPRLEPLLRDGGFGHGYQRNAYGAAWALVYYLRRCHATEFRTFLDLLRLPDSHDPPRHPLIVRRIAFARRLVMTSPAWKPTGTRRFDRFALRSRKGNDCTNGSDQIG